MARPTSKEALLTAASTQYEKLQSLIASMSGTERSAPLDYDPASPKKEAHWDRDKNLRDILVHLYEWHQLLLRWVSANQSGEALGGETVPFLPSPYTWKSYGQLNVEFWEKHQRTSEEDARAMLDVSHREVLTLIDSFTNEELFEKKHFPWTGTTNLGSYCISATSSHYDWAMKKLRAHLKAVRTTSK